MNDSPPSPLPAGPLAHGGRMLPAVTVDTYNEELRDEEGFVGDRASRRAFRAILADWRERLGDSVYVWGVVGGPGGIAFVQVSRVGTHPRRSPAVYFVSRQRGSEWSDLVPAGGGLGEGSPNFIWFSRDSCYVHFTRDYSSFVRVPLSTAISAH